MTFSGEEDPKARKETWMLKQLLGFGFFIQGFRCLPWLAVIFFLKDGLKLDPSYLQLLQLSANLPMVAKPLYGILSDSVYIRGQHRIPYIALGGLLQSVSWLAISILPPSCMSISKITIYLVTSNLGASLVEVANDAVVAEASSSTGNDLQPFVWMASSAGGIAGNFIGGVAINYFSPQAMFLCFGLLLAAQFVVTIAITETSLKLPTTTSNGVRTQISDLMETLKKREIAAPITWFAASYALIPVMTGTMFFYQTQHLGISSSVVGMSKVFGQLAMLLWCFIYNRYLKAISAKKLLFGIQVSMAALMASDAVFACGGYKKLGFPDSVYVVVVSGLLEVLFFFKILPFSVVIAQLCPTGCEGSLMAFLMSAVALALMVSGYLGVALAAMTTTGDEFSGLSWGLLIQAAATLVPLCWVSCVPDHGRKKVD